jgi:REP element-mobilizing transposase RayT
MKCDIDRRGFPTPPTRRIMPKLRHIDLREFPYAVTTVTASREPLFEESKAADIVLDAILFGKREHWYCLLSFVIMPDHVHLIIIPRDKNISECMKSIKGFSARQINAVFDRRGPIWQGGFYDYILDSEEKVLSRMRYIEDNPVRKGLVTNAEDYAYSSMKYRAETDFTKFF